MYTFDTTASIITHPVEFDDFTAITQRDFDREDEDNYDNLSTLLDNIEGVSDTDYNGMFGSFLFFTISADFDNDAKREEIRLLITNYINGWGEFA